MFNLISSNWQFRLIFSIIITIIVVAIIYNFFYLPEKKWEEDPKNKEAVEFMNNPSCKVPWKDKEPQVFKAEFPKKPHSKYSASARYKLVWLAGVSSFLICYFLVAEYLCEYLGKKDWINCTKNMQSAELTPAMDKVSHWIGTVAVLLMTIATFLQVHKTAQTANIESFSLIGLILFALADTLWFTNSMIRNNHSLTVEKLLAIFVGIGLIITGLSNRSNSIPENKKPKVVCLNSDDI